MRYQLPRGYRRYLLGLAMLALLCIAAAVTVFFVPVQKQQPQAQYLQMCIRDRDRRCHSGKSSLAVGARNMDALKLLFRVSQVVQQCLHTLQGDVYKRQRFALFRVRSPLLTESRLMSLPRPTSMFPFRRFPRYTLSLIHIQMCIRDRILIAC